MGEKLPGFPKQYSSNKMVIFHRGSDMHISKDATKSPAAVSIVNRWSLTSKNLTSQASEEKKNNLNCTNPILLTAIHIECIISKRISLPWTVFDMPHNYGSFSSFVYVSFTFPSDLKFFNTMLRIPFSTAVAVGTVTMFRTQITYYSPESTDFGRNEDTLFTN